MDRLEAMRVFSAVVDAGSFVAAADALGMSKAATSRHVADLEARLGVRLMHRTTRRLSLTPEGELFHARCKTVLADLEEAEAEITARTGEAIGQLKINVPVSFGLLHLAPLWADFMALHPKVVLDITLSDRVVDLVDEGYDLAVRITQMPNSTLVSRKLSSTRVVLCASPEYLAQRGMPTHPSELTRYDVLAYSLMSMGETWEFTGPEGNVRVKVNPRLRTNNGDTCRAAALQHRGIILQPTFLVGDDLASGALVELMPEYRSIEIGIYAVYPTRKHVPPKVRLLIEFLAKALESRAWGG